MAVRERIVRDDINTIAAFLDDVRDSTTGSSDAGLESPPFDFVVSIGSTPSVFQHKSVPDLNLNLPQIEIHPGNYTMFDRQQQYVGVCNEDDISGRVIARVIGHYPDRNTIMVDAGATALTKEQTPQGGVFAIGGHPELECFRMSQEVSLIRKRPSNHTDTTAGVDNGQLHLNEPFPFEDFPLDSMVNLLPNHSCLAAACFSEYHIVEGSDTDFCLDQEVVEVWKPTKFF